MKPRIHRQYLFLLLIIAFLATECTTKTGHPRVIYDLSGNWLYRLDDKKTGMAEKWYLQMFTDSVRFPGTLDENMTGWLNPDTTCMHLSRVYQYEGAAWFKKEIEVPAGWENKHIELIMERTKVTNVWLDSIYLGTNNNIFSRQVYDLTRKLTAGKHTLNITVDNDIRLVPVEGSHAYEENTQTNWNGILGMFCLEISELSRIKQIRIIPDIQKKNIRVQVITDIPLTDPGNYAVTLYAKAWNTSKKHHVRPVTFPLQKVSGEKETELVYELGDDARPWSEFNPVLYKLYVILNRNGKPTDNRSVDFGLKEFRTNGTNFSINGLKTFLRGKQDGCVFPLTGHPPMDTAGWSRIFRIARSYGLNHYRFHSWCPPEAAFLAADICGIYLQPELPIWWSFQAHDSSQVAFVMKEGYNMLDNYGNHASFVMMALGNEIFQDRQVLRQMVSDFRKYDDRRLYAQGSNNWLSDPVLAAGDDYWTTFRTGKEKPDCSTDVRASISFADSREGGILNTFYPSSDRTFSEAIKGIPVPVIGHETGQYQVYPNYNEISKYTGVLKPLNLEIFKKRLEDKGMMDQAGLFFLASGKLSAICYRDEIEMAVRTPGFGGFQLLDLQDYPGQGTALVGMLDAFMDSKGLITPASFRQFCNDVVIMAIMKKYCWTSNENLAAEIRVANFGPSGLENKNIIWKLADENGKVHYSGNGFSNTIPQGEITTIQEIMLNLNNFSKAVKVYLDIQIEGTSYKTRYPVWVFPQETPIEVPEEIMVARRLDGEAATQLEKGGSVLLFPDFKSNEKNSVEGMYITDFWNWVMFKTISEQYDKKVSPGTMGLLTDPSHPVFNAFPTDYHSDRQWWTIVKNSRPVILDKTPGSYRPIVQVIDNIGRNHKLGLIFEMKAGNGKLLVCASNLPAIIDKPEARQLYAGILNYMQSAAFEPETLIPQGDIKKLLD
ncbi:MAG: beta-glycosidase [Bacteroidales bacterium]|nr:beta-glycosidase [Bacteroidales bacterium]